LTGFLQAFISLFYLCSSSQFYRSILSPIEGNLPSLELPFFANLGVGSLRTSFFILLFWLKVNNIESLTLLAARIFSSWVKGSGWLLDVGLRVFLEGVKKSDGNFLLEATLAPVELFLS
jgi:hypothetical protein